MAGIQQVSFTDPYSADENEILRRQKLAEMLQAQSAAPLPTNRMAGRVAIPISPWEGAAKLAQGYSAANADYQANEKRRELVRQMQADRANSLNAAMAQMQGTPAKIQDTTGEGTGSFDMSGTQGPANVPGIAPNPQGAYMALAQSNDPSLRQVGMMQLIKQGEPYTLAAGANRYGPGNTVVASNPKPLPVVKPIVHDLPVGNDMVQPHISLDNGQTWKPVEGSQPIPKFAKSVGPTIVNAPPVTPVTIQDPNDPNKTQIVDGRTGKVIGQGPKLTQSGSAEQKLSLSLPEARSHMLGVDQNLDRLSAQFQALHDDPGLSNITGPVYGRTPNLTASATGAMAKYKALTSNIFQGSLLAMREASKTGGAVGNVSDREGDKLEQTMAAIDRAQSTEDFQKQLKLGMEQVRLSKERIHRAFEEQYGGVISRNPPSPNPSPAPGQSKYREGQTATGPNGEKMIFRNGQWVPNGR